MRGNLRLYVAGAALALGINGCNAQEKIDTALTLQGDTANGQIVYTNVCQECHAADLKGTNEGPNISNDIPRDTDEQLMSIAVRGKGDMPGFNNDMTDQDLADLIAFLRQAAP